MEKLRDEKEALTYLNQENVVVKSKVYSLGISLKKAQEELSISLDSMNAQLE